MELETRRVIWFAVTWLKLDEGGIQATEEWL